MFDEGHYVPILKGLVGEYRALREADGRVRARLTPLIEIPSVGWNFATDKEAKSLEDHVSGVSRSVEDAWGRERRFFIDGGLLPSGELLEGVHPLRRVLDSGRDRDLLMVPVTGTSRGNAYDEAVAHAVARDRRGVCLRIGSTDLESPEEIPKLIDAVRDPLGLDCADIDLLVDLGSVSSSNGLAVATVKTVLSELPQLDAWRSLTLAATSFPVDLSDVQGDSDGDAPREEWKLWRALFRRQRSLLRMPTFGDYGVAHPVPRLLDPRVVKRSAQIRYTVDEDFLLIKGRSIKDNGADQQHELAARLVARPDFRGEEFSWGDSYIARCARREVGPGNGSTWRAVGTSQHAAFVTAQVASLTGL